MPRAVRPSALAGAAPHPAREPDLRVHQVVIGPLRARPPQDAAKELWQEPRQLLLGHGRARSGLDVDQPGAVPELLDLGTPLVPRAGEHVHLDTARRQALGRRPDEDVHPAGVARTRLVERGRVQANDGDPRLSARRRALAGGPFGRDASRAHKGIVREVAPNAAERAPSAGATTQPEPHLETHRPAGRPRARAAPPGTRGRRAALWSSRPSRSSARTNACAAARSLPSSTRTAIPDPGVGDGGAVQAFGPHLADEAGHRLHQSRVRTAAPRHQVRRRSHRLDRSRGAQNRGDRAARVWPAGRIGWPCRAKGARGTGAPHPSTPTYCRSGPRRWPNARRARTPRWRGCEESRQLPRSAPERSHARSMPACLPEQLWVIRRGSAAARRASASIGRIRGHPRSRSDRPPARRRRRTTRTWTGSPLCEAHISGDQDRRGAARRAGLGITAACNGFIEEREKTTRSGSPSAASTPPLDRTRPRDRRGRSPRDPNARPGRAARRSAHAKPSEPGAGWYHGVESVSRRA